MTVSRLDQIYRSILLTKFFTKGWGSPDKLKQLFAFRKYICQREFCYPLVEKDYPIIIDKEEVQSDCILLEGHFKSPFAQHLPGVAPKESETAHFQVILPKRWPTNLRPMCLHLAGTGDHYFWRRRTFMAKPLLKEAGIGSIILENPFYGLRKPKDQLRSSLHNVSDIFVMGGCLALESIALFHWCERQGLGPLGVTGISMGGHMASIAAGAWPKPLVLVPCLSWTTASCVFTQGVMSGAIPWHLLENQYRSDTVYHQEFRNMVHSLDLVDDDMFKAGQHFAKNYPENLDKSQHKNISRRPSISSSSTNKMQLSSTELSNNSGSLTLSQHTVSKLASLPLKDDSHTALMSKLSGMSLSNVFHNSILGSLNSRRSSKCLYNEALQFMRGIMDEFTHLSNFSHPVDPSLTIVVAARDDAYVLREGIMDLEDLWPGCEIRYLDAGHITAFLFNQSMFRKAIADGFDKHIAKYELNKKKAQENIAKHALNESLKS